MRDDGGPAYPCEIEIHFGSGRTEIKREPGMSLRDKIAMSARHEDLPIPEKISDCASMLGVPASEWDGAHFMELVAKLRYEYADIVLKERAK